MLLADPHAHCFEAVNHATGDIIGVITGVALSRFDAFNLLKISTANAPDYIQAYDKLAIFKTIAIDDTQKGLGVGSKLTQKLLERFCDIGMEAVACVAWQYLDSKGQAVENISGIMNRFDFSCHAKIPDFWRDDGDSFICPACGAPPCRCQANIYFKQLN